MDDPVFKQKYHKYKTKVKVWEKSFKEINGRVPSKHDIREAPSAIRDSYKMYYKLKTSFLEETLSDALDEDSFDLSILENSSQSELRTSSSFSELSTPDVSALTNENSIILPLNNSGFGTRPLATASNGNCESRFSQEFDAEIVNSVNENAWIDVKKGSPTAAKESSSISGSGSTLRKSLSNKLYRNSSFLMRNPRKSLSKNSLASQNSQSSLPSSQSSLRKESFPDLETILSQKSKQQTENDDNDVQSQSQTVPATPLDMKAIAAASTTINSVKHLDDEWLKRCNQANSIGDFNHTNTMTNEQSSSNAADKPKVFGISNINAAALAKFEQKQILDSPEIGAAKTMLSFDMGSLNLTATNSFVDDSAMHLDVINYGEADDDEIANSEDEAEVNTSRQIRSIRGSIKRKRSEIDDVIPSTKLKGSATTGGVTPIDRPANQNQRHGEPKDDANVTVRRTKSKAKPKAVPKTKPVEAKPKVEVVQRRSSRNVNKTTSYKEIEMGDLNAKRDNGNDVDDDEKEEDDPFAGDDSDNDPNFAIPQSPKSKQPIKSDSDSSSECSDTEKPKAVKKETTAKPAKQRVQRIKKAPALSTAVPKIRSSTGARKVKTVRKKSEPKKTDPHNSSLDENGAEPPEMPDDYLMEFGIEQITSVPRIPVTELQQTTMEFSKYVCSAPPATATTVNARQNGTTKSHAAGTSAIPAVSTKQSMAREKLESRIAAGSLNDNYVRLNLRKKVFVRGKKTVNFSRYKKKLWKSKKAAALSGPDMDMGGCDGGILKCFQCGMPGHFAQNCKIKSDRLLPLTVEEESPFPTLDEVEQMSNQQIKLVHANRELPQVDNPTWKNGSEEVDPTEESAGIALTPTKINMSDTTTPTPTPTESVASASFMTPATVPTQNYIGHKIPEEFLKKAGLLGSDTDDGCNVEPLYKLNADGSIRATPAEVYDALKMFGHEQFRGGQERAVMRILSGQSTLVTLSTGSGKSLCYQLPAYMYSRRKRCITLVISPLVSLMDDQVRGVPHFLNAQCLHSNLTAPKRAATMAAIKAGEVDVLLISPEAVVSSEKATGFGSILRDLPPVAFVCIDECHCVSQFGHNFRPSYLMICRVLYEKLKIKTVLGLTATATMSTRLSIVEHLRIPDGLDGVISDIPLPDNLTLTISCDDNRNDALIQLLREPRFAEYKSIIIYCARREDCVDVAKHLRTAFQDDIKKELQQKNASGKRGRTELKSIIEPYHAGMGGSARRTIQNKFMRGDLKIVVATIAFGMGINKADIRCVIHYNMPMNFESYVQEVGRAGRDGKPAHCHLFLDSQGGDKVHLRRHVYANSIDRHVIRKLLHKIFIPCACKKPTESKAEATQSNAQDASIMSDIDAVQQIDWNDEMKSDADGHAGVPAKRKCPGHEVCFSVDETVQELDIPEENIATLLCYLELHDRQYVKTLSKAYIRCKVLAYGGPKALKAAAQKCPPLAMAIALDIRKGIPHETSTFIEFPVIEIASAIGWNSGVVKYQLKQLEWTTENGQPKRSNISVEFSDLGFRVLAPGDLSATELDATLDMLYSRVREQEQNQLNQLENIFHGLTSVAVKSSLACANVEPNDERSERLKKLVREYFQSSKMIEYPVNDESSKPSDPAADRYIINDIQTMITRYPENNFTGRSIARIFHGVQSPVFPAVIWSRCNYWRAHLQTDFNHIVKLANAVILNNRTL